MGWPHRAQAGRPAFTRSQPRRTIAAACVRVRLSRPTPRSLASSAGSAGPELLAPDLLRLGRLGRLVVGLDADLLGQDHDAVRGAVVGQLQAADRPFGQDRLGQRQ